MWVEHTLRTAREAHPIFSTAYGIEQPYELIGQANISEGDLSTFSDAIETALLVHDRIVAVEDFSFSQDPFEEEMYASFTVVLDSAPPMNPQTVEFSNVQVT